MKASIDDLDGFFTFVVGTENGFAVLREEWQSMHYLHQQPVRLLAPNGTERFGVVQGVAEDGTLLLDEAGVLQRIHAGEISLREC